jgi:hypothetical protein
VRWPATSYYCKIVGSATVERVPSHAPETAQNRSFAPVRRSFESQHQTSPLCGKDFTVPRTGEVAVLGPLGGVGIFCRYRGVGVPRRRALGLALFHLVQHVVGTLRWGFAPSAASAFKTTVLLLFVPKGFGIQCGLDANGKWNDAKRRGDTIARLELF